MPIKFILKIIKQIRIYYFLTEYFNILFLHYLTIALFISSDSDIKL